MEYAVKKMFYNIKCMKVQEGERKHKCINKRSDYKCNTGIFTIPVPVPVYLPVSKCKQIPQRIVKLSLTKNALFNVISVVSDHQKAIMILAGQT